MGDKYEIIARNIEDVAWTYQFNTDDYNIFCAELEKVNKLYQIINIQIRNFD